MDGRYWLVLLSEFDLLTAGKGEVYIFSARSLKDTLATWHGIREVRTGKAIPATIEYKTRPTGYRVLERITGCGMWLGFRVSGFRTGKAITTMYVGIIGD